MSGSNSWVTARTYGAVFMAEMAVGILEDAGIPAMTRGEYAGIFGPGWVGPVPKGIDVLVPAHRLEEARELLADDEELDASPEG